MDRNRMSSYSEPEPEDQNETEQKKKKMPWDRQEAAGKEVLDEDLKCFHYWLPDASMR